MLLGGLSAFQWYQQASLDYNNNIKTNFLTDDDQLLLMVFIPVVVVDVPVPPDLQKIITNIDQAIGKLPRRTQDELREMFDLLGSLVGRLFLAGVWLNWQKADALQIDRFLNSWRDHSFSLLQQAYIGLRQLIVGSVYAEPRHWDAIGYPGPIKL